VQKLLKDSSNSSGDKIKPLIKSRMIQYHDRDKVIVPLLKARVNQIDCLANGWVIDGYPSNINQAREFEKAGITPSKVIFLDLPDHEARSRIENRRVDPSTGLFYNISQTADHPEHVVKRLQRHPDDNERAVEALIEEYKQHGDELKKFYQQNSKKIDGSRSEQTIHELIEDFIRS